MNGWRWGHDRITAGPDEAEDEEAAAAAVPKQRNKQNQAARALAIKL